MNKTTLIPHFIIKSFLLIVLSTSHTMLPMKSAPILHLNINSALAKYNAHKTEKTGAQLLDIYNAYRVQYKQEKIDALENIDTKWLAATQKMNHEEYQENLTNEIKRYQSLRRYNSAPTPVVNPTNTLTIEFHGVVKNNAEDSTQQKKQELLKKRTFSAPKLLKKLFTKNKKYCMQ